ncbi:MULTISPECIES: toxin-antitoxin system TumE family protein [Thiorhodovibrio]|uniref:toxin-antitoxin system TumE family protein n=1 Tax=Thiorhodovibrio TaxID=61593 RepID=UPI001913EA0F|nr:MULTISPECIES: DUF6516 family protein [Thiorhodovibrio]MBK5971155.1 hypothetical protein [Thiorhodovibrio winogradskyi]WPL10476.1 hypothetical protein Thiosp_00191 [Thiorhodovibrio litoralis]
MAATLLARAKEVRDNGSIVEVVIWELPKPLPPCRHRYKYRLFFGTRDRCRVRYDNERGKGDHRHFASEEQPYPFTTLDQIIADFRADIARWESPK